MQLRRPALWIKWLLAMIFVPAGITPAAEWLRLMPQGQWKRTPSLETGSSDVQAVQVSGNYAYLADENDGLQVIDVSNPASPQRAGGYDTGGIAWNLATRDSLVYLADLNAGLVVIDVTKPSEPKRSGGYAVGALGVALQGIYAYVACGTNGVHVVDISDPTRPERMGSCAVPGEAYGIALLDDYAYVVDFRAGLLVVVSIENPGAPQVIGTYQAGLNPSDVAVAGGQAYVAAGTSGLLIWDIRDPAQAKLIGRWQGDCIIGRVSLSGSYVFLTGGICSGDTVRRAVRVIDVEHPVKPVRVGGLDDIGTRGLARSGDYLYVADGHEGLQIIKVTELPAFTSQSVANKDLTLTWNQAARGFTLQRTTSLPEAAWEDVPNSETTNSVVLPIVNLSAFFRLRLQTSGPPQLAEDVSSGGRLVVGGVSHHEH
jgi:hypothetical protein